MASQKVLQQSNTSHVLEQAMISIQHPSQQTPQSYPNSFIRGVPKKRCDCCPYGYHIDLDFIRYCEQLALNAKQPSDDQMQRRNLRRQRKSMDVMLGFNEALQDFESDILLYEQQQQQQQHSQQRLKPISTVCETSEVTDAVFISGSPSYEQQTTNDYNEIVSFRKRCLSAPSERDIEQNEFMKNVFYDVCSDFERTLERASVRQSRRRKTIEPSLNYRNYVANQKSTIQTIERESLEVYQTANNTTVNGTTIINKIEQIPTNQKENFNEINSQIAIINTVESNDQIIQIQRELEKSLLRICILEKDVKSIAKLQSELEREKAKNFELIKKLRSLELELLHEKEKELQREKSPTIIQNQKLPFSSQRVSAVSLENLNFSTHLSKINSTLRKSIDLKSASLPPAPPLQSLPPIISKREIGCMTQSPLKRDIGIQSQQITKLEIKEPHKPILISVGVQSDAEKKIPHFNVSTSTDAQFKPSTRSIGILAEPIKREKSCTASPNTRTIGTENIFEKIYTRNAYTETMTPTNDLTTIGLSLKSMDTELPQQTKKPLLITTGSQTNQTNLLNKSSQCNKIDVQKQIASTDTNDLILKINRSIGTDKEKEKLKQDRQTNTDRMISMEKSTNTIQIPDKQLVHIATEPIVFAKNTIDTSTECSRTFDEIVKEAVEIEMKKLESMKKNEQIKTETTTTKTETNHECNNCLAKVEIRQQTIIKNPKKMNQHQIDEDASSRIPRPTALISPRPDRKFIRQDTYTLPLSTIGGDCPAEALLSSQNVSTARTSTENQLINDERTSELFNKLIPTNPCTSSTSTTTTTQRTTTESNSNESKLLESNMKRSSTYSRLASSSKSYQKIKPSKEMQAALKVINDSLLKNQHLATTLKNANKIVQNEWFRISSTENAQPLNVEDYLDCFEEYSTNLLKYVVNMTDANGNTAMHYAISHGNFDVVSILLDSKVCNINHMNNAGYTCIMLVSLAKLQSDEHGSVVQRLFQMADVNVRAKKHSQTALMLATSHGNYEMVRMLLDAGADVNIQDEDGSTALMCAAEHGHMDIVKILLAQPDCNSTIQDMDGSTALKISLEAGHRDIGVLLYAHEYMTKNKSPYTSLRRSERRRNSASNSSVKDESTIKPNDT